MEKKLQKEKELQKEFWKIGNTIFWTLNAAILFSIILDIIILSENWLNFVFSKLILFSFFYFTYNFFKKKYKTPNLLIHLTLFSFNFLTLISISYSTVGNRIIYITMLIALFVAFNTIAVWRSFNSLIQYFLIIFSFIILVYMDIIMDPLQILEEGGYLFLSLGFISLFIPRVRAKMVIERISLQLVSNQKISLLESELSEIKTKYNLLKEKVSKKENESKFLFQQINNDLNKINEVANEIEENTFKKKKIEDLNSLLQNLRNQSSIYFSPVNLITNDLSYSKDIIDIKTIYLEVFKSFENQIEEKNITGVDKLLATNTLIIGNEKMFKTIIYNILNFMVIFSNENEEIEVNIDNLRKDVFFSVANKTHGIDTKEIESYFRDLEFVDYDYKKHSDSVKIGLRISKQLTQKMNGYFSYVSSENMGFELKIQFKTYK